MTTIPDVPIPNSPRAEMARQMVAQVRTLIESLEGFVFMTSSERLRVNTSSNVSDRFLIAVAVALEASEPLTISTRLTPAELREIVAYSQAVVGLADELERLTRGVRDTIKLRRAEVATEALRVLSIAKKMNRPGDRQELVSSVEHMQRALGRGRKKAAPKPAEPNPSP
jgi:magnesium-transporting ATPase (P-type)